MWAHEPAALLCPQLHVLNGPEWVRDLKSKKLQLLEIGAVWEVLGCRTSQRPSSFEELSKILLAITFPLLVSFCSLSCTNKEVWLYKWKELKNSTSKNCKALKYFLK